MTAPFIGITTYGRDENQKFALPIQYVDAVRRAGGLPVLLPPGEPNWRQLLVRLDGLLLTGGGDIDPSVYGGSSHPALYMLDPERDQSDLSMVREVVARGLPTFGICRGAQVVNVALGGKLIEHLPDVVGDTVPHRAPPRLPVRHPVNVTSGSILGSILQETQLSPVSWHHQAIRELGASLEIVARAPDGTIEAVEMRSHPWLIAVQWHPELSAADDPEQQRLFDAFVEAARNHSRR